MTSHPTARVDEIADGIYRISTSVPPTAMPGGFTFNQFLIDDEEPLLFHTGPRKLFPVVSAAVASVLPLERLRHIAFSHFEADECGSLNEFLAAAPASAPLCGRVAAMVSVDDVADRPAHALDDGETLVLGTHTVSWHDTPHLPHGWECGFLSESTTGTLFCGDLFTQGGDEHEPVTEKDILAPSMEMLGAFDYYSHTKNAQPLFDKLIATQPQLLACMHGAAWRGDGAELLRALARELV
jgi:flavorubredoxin